MSNDSLLKNIEDEPKAKPFFMSYKFLILTLVLVVLSFPYKTLEVPEWKVTVLDESGLPINNIEITQNYKNYTFGNEQWETRKTDDNGVVVFPEVILRMPLLFRLLYSVLGYASKYIHGGMGSSANIRPEIGEIVFYDHKFRVKPRLSLGVLGTEKYVTSEKLETTFRKGSKPIY